MSTPAWRQPVIVVPLQQVFPDLSEIKEFRSKVCIFNHDRTKLFDVVSPRYHVIQHAEAFDRVEEGLEAYFKKKVTSNIRTIDGGARFRAEFKLPMRPIKVGGSDVSEITMVMQNSYNRSLTFSAELGAFRLICSNGMKIGQSFGSIKARHVSGVEGWNILDAVDKMVLNAPRLKEVWQEWEGQWVQYEEAVELLNGQFPDKYLTPVLSEERYPRTKWQLYNDLTSFATHDVGSVRRRMEFDDRIASLFYGDAGIEGAELVD